jgi:hypothetical protein
MKRGAILITAAFALLAAQVAFGAELAGNAKPLPTLDQAVASNQDVWGLAAMAEPNGPSYAFFEKLLPPLRYVNAQFRHYPIVLSAPNATNKARLISNGSGVNLVAGLKSWKEVGVPVTFRVGADDALYGEDLRNLDGPQLESGYLPIVKLNYKHDGITIQEEAFASTEPALSRSGVLFFQFSVKEKVEGKIAVRFETSGPWKVSNGTVQNTNGHIVAWFDTAWQWEESQRQLVARVASANRPTLALATRPATVDSQQETLGGGMVSTDSYATQRSRCIATWKELLSQGMQIDVPEPLVNDAWRALVISLFTLTSNDRPNYSAGNAYERVYQAESGDIARALLLWNFSSQAQRMIPHLLDYTRDKLKFHNSGFKLQTLSHGYWLTRDTNYLASVRPKWEESVKNIVEGREMESGLFPREQYCGDIHTLVYSLHSNGAGWRGLRDFAAVLADSGERERAGNLAKSAEELRNAIFKATAKSERRDVQPPFIPVALFGEEKPYDRLTDSMLGSYWDLIAPYMLGSGMFGPGSERETAIMDYLHERGGICMGMIRFHQHSGLFANEDALDDLYGVRYTLKLLERDKVDRALVSFYGKLAQGLTRETFVGAEGTGLRPLDEFGRPMYLPPNATAQAYFLWMLRYMLVQDWDLNDDGIPETLRLGFATPKRWLEDGKSIRVEHAPTAFGPVSLVMESRLARGEVIARVKLPERNHPAKTLMRVRVPDGWRVASASAGGRRFSIDADGTTDISNLVGAVELQFAVEKR